MLTFEEFVKYADEKLSYAEGTYPRKQLMSCFYTIGYEDHCPEMSYEVKPVRTGFGVLFQRSKDSPKLLAVPSKSMLIPLNDYFAANAELVQAGRHLVFIPVEIPAVLSTVLYHSIPFYRVLPSEEQISDALSRLHESQNNGKASAASPFAAGDIVLGAVHGAASAAALGGMSGALPDNLRDIINNLKADNETTPRREGTSTSCEPSDTASPADLGTSDV
jgi:hypothetical protein